MRKDLMLLPCRDFDKARLVRVPEDMDERDAFRHATGVIAAVEEEARDYDWDDLAAALEDHGFTLVEFMLGPELDL